MLRGDSAFLVFIIACVWHILWSRSRESSFSSALYSSSVAIGAYITTIAFLTVAYRLSPFHPLARFPGPILYKVSTLRLGLLTASGHRSFAIRELHKRYGDFVRTGDLSRPYLFQQNMRA